MKHERLCQWDIKTLRRELKNMTRNGVFLVKFDMSGEPMKQRP